MVFVTRGSKVTITVKEQEAILDIEALINKAKTARKLIIDMAASDKGCHIGGSLSVIDLLIGAYGKYGNDQNSSIILSKGHAAAALYAAMYVFQKITDDPSISYGKKDSLFTGHPNHKIENIEFSTGSLGHGISYGAGCALAQKIKGTKGKAIVIGGDGELQEGLCWETMQIIQAKSLDNLIYIVDCNGAQNDGFLDDISPINNLRERFESFGFNVLLIDGHDIQEITDVLNYANYNKPLAILAKTVKGKGVKAIEGNPNAHYAKITSTLSTRWKRGIR